MLDTLVRFAQSEFVITILCALAYWLGHKHGYQARKEEENESNSIAKWRP